MGEPGVPKQSLGQWLIPNMLDIHSTLPTQAGILKMVTRYETPQNSIGDTSGPFNFLINCGENEQIYPAGMRIFFAIQVRNSQTHAKATPYDSGTKQVVGKECFVTVNGMGSAYFSDIAVWLDKTQIAFNDGMYAYKGDLYKRLFCNTSSQKHSMQMAGWDSESQPWEEVCDTQNKANAAVGFDQTTHDAILKTGKAHSRSGEVWSKRYAHHRGRKYLTYLDKLYSEIFLQPKLLPPGKTLRIELQRQKPSFCLMTVDNDPTLEIHLEKIMLIVPIAKVATKMVRGIKHKTFQGEKECYPLRRVELTQDIKGAGISNLGIDNIILGSITPRRFFVMILHANAIHGTWTYDPFNYASYALSRISCRLGGGESPSMPSIKRDEVHQDILAVYYLLKTLGSEGGAEDEIGIDLSNFGSRNHIYPFDVNGLSGVELSNAFTKEEKMSVSLDIPLATATPNPTALLIVKEYDAEITIDNKDDILYDRYG